MKFYHKKLKKTAAVLLAAASIMSLAACTSRHQKPQNPQTQQTQSGKENRIFQIPDLAGFDTVDMDGKQVTADFLKEHKLTLVNLMSSTCNPCMEELPGLMKLAEEFKDKGVGFLGVNLDMDMQGNPDQESAEIMQKLQKKNGSAMKIVFPDQVLLEKVLVNVSAMPYTFFVDSEGNVVGGDYLEDKTQDQWREIIQKELEK